VHYIHHGYTDWDIRRTGDLLREGERCRTSLGHGPQRRGTDLGQGLARGGGNGLLAALGRVTGVSRGWIFQPRELTDTHITQNYTFEWAAAARYRAKHQSRNRLS